MEAIMIDLSNAKLDVSGITDNNKILLEVYLGIKKTGLELVIEMSDKGCFHPYPHGPRVKIYNSSDRENYSTVALYGNKIFRNQKMKNIKKVNSVIDFITENKILFLLNYYAPVLDFPVYYSPDYIAKIIRFMIKDGLSRHAAVEQMIRTENIKISVDEYLNLKELEDRFDAKRNSKHK